MIQFYEITDSGDDLATLKRFYETLYIAEFPDPDERESLENMVAYLRLKARGWYGPNNYHIVLATEGGQLVGGSIADFLASAQTGVIEFLLVAPAGRRSGVGRALLEHTEQLLSDDALRSLGRPLALVVAEMNDPFAATRTPDNMDPSARTLVWHHFGYRGLDFPYTQPALSDEQVPVDNLILICKPFWPAWSTAVPAAVVKTVLHEYLRWAMRIDRPDLCAEYRSMATYLDHCDPVRTIPLDTYVGQDEALPMHVGPLIRADAPDFQPTMALYRSAFGNGMFTIDEVEFRNTLAAERRDSCYHLWSLRRVAGKGPVEGMASFHSLRSAGFGGYLALAGALRGTGRFRLLVARIEEQMLRDCPSARGWYIEADPATELAPFLKVGFREVAIDYVQPSLGSRSSDAPARLLFKPFGRCYGPPREPSAAVLSALEEILATVYGVAEPVRHALYKSAATTLARAGDETPFR